MTSAKTNSHDQCAPMGMPLIRRNVKLDSSCASWCGKPPASERTRRVRSSPLSGGCRTLGAGAGRGEGSAVGGYRLAVDAGAYASSLRRDGFELADAAEGRLDAPVPSCPEWSVADLVYHTGEVHDFWGQIAREGLLDPHETSTPPRPPDEELLEWFRRGVERLAETLEYADPGRAVWSWSPQKNIAFIQRRMAQETAVHRWDAQAAVGAAKPIDPELARDGVDEFLDLFLPAEPEGLRGGRESVHLHSTDVPGEWLVRVDDGELSITREHAKGDAAVRAPASALLLLLWRRLPSSAVEVFGDRDALERFLARADLT